MLLSSDGYIMFENGRGFIFCHLYCVWAETVSASCGLASCNGRRSYGSLHYFGRIQHATRYVRKENIQVTVCSV